METIDAAARLGTYFLAHALAVFDLMGADPVVEDGRAVLDWITRTGTESFTRRDAFNANRPRFAKVADIDPALSLLTDHGWVQPLDAVPRSPTGGRPPSPRFAVNPSTHNPHNPQNPAVL